MRQVGSGLHLEPCGDGTAVGWWLTRLGRIFKLRHYRLDQSLARSAGAPHRLRRIGFDEKGDVTGYDTYVWYVCNGGEFAPLK